MEGRRAGSDLRQCRTSAGAFAPGFTLVEILVVIAIISILAGLSIYGLGRAVRSGHVRDEEVHLRMVASEIEAFANALGDYPPATLESLGVAGNGINEGNESLFLHLETRKGGGPFTRSLAEDRWSNTDGDRLSAGDAERVRAALGWLRPGGELLEYTDRWGNPYVYISSAEYGRRFRYRTRDGMEFEVEAARNPHTGGFSAPTTFQLWSIGPDGVNQNGEGDDIASWK